MSATCTATHQWWRRRKRSCGARRFVCQRLFDDDNVEIDSVFLALVKSELK